MDPSRRDRLGRALGLALYVAFIPVVLGISSGTQIFWTVAIALLPAGFTLFGFYAWRRACPLAQLGQLGRLVGRPGKRKVGERLARSYPSIQLGVLCTALVLRHLGLNASPVLLAGFLVAISLAAAVVSFVYTGKTWCNFFCPVGMVEKIYAEPVHLREQANAQCTPCTACKKSCPDIDLELAYWKELDLPARRRAYFAWPGIVLGFYAYFLLAAGSSGFTSGAWLREPLAPVLGPGLSFAPWLPRLVAVPLTLLGFGLVSFGAVAFLERLALARTVEPAARAQVRHRAFTLCGFAGFVLFYAFAGTPTVQLLPAPLAAGLGAATIVLATLVLVRRWDRREEGYVKEQLARGLLRRWSDDWGEAPPRLQDVYLLHSERQRQRESRLSAYQETLCDMIADGIVSRNEIALLSKLRTQLGIGDADHEKVIAELSAGDQQLLDPQYQGSVERRLMLEQLAGELERLVAAGSPPDAAALEVMRQERGVSTPDWEEALTALRAPGGALAERVRETAAAMATLRRAQRRAGRERAASRTMAFFHALIDWRLAQHARRAQGLLEAAGEQGGALAPLLGELPTADDAEDARALVEVGRDHSPYLRAAAAYALSRFDDAAAQVAAADATTDRSPLVRETAVRALAARGRLSREMAARAVGDADPRVRAAVTRVTQPGEGYATLDREAALSTLSTFEIMTFLAGVPLFAGLTPDDLEALSQLARERRVAAGQDLCAEGDAGRDVFVLISGSTRAWVMAGGEQRVLGEEGPGSCIGEMAALDEAPRTATVTALSEARALVISGADFKELLEARPPIAREVLRVLSQRLRGMITQTVRTAS